PETAETVATLDHPVWRYPAITRNRFGAGTLTYEATVVTDTLQREIVREALGRAGLMGADQQLPATVKVRHGRTARGLMHYYLNFSGERRDVGYPYESGVELLSGARVEKGKTLVLGAWDLAIVAER